MLEVFLRADRSIHAALLLLAGSVLMLEVALTRIFSVMLWNHYTFLVISTALLGFGAAGAFLAVSDRGDSGEDERRFLARNSLLFAVVTVLSVMAVTRLDLEPTRILLDFENSAKMFGMYLLSASPFFFAGLAIARLLTICAAQINTLYFADLAGAGLGAMAVPILLGGVGAPTAVIIACVLATLAATIFAGPDRRLLFGGAAVAFGGLAVFVSLQDPWTVHPPVSKPLRKFEDRVLESRWTLHARIDVLETRHVPLDFGSGVSADFFEPVDYRTVYMDGSNPSRLISHDQDPWFLKRLLTAGPYQIARDEPEVLIIGSGGGIDTLVARHHGAGRVVAVEINPGTVKLVTEDFADYIGDPYSDPRVELVAAEGRHFLTLDDSRYDIIRLTGVDTSAAGASAGNALDSAYIYTTEAVGELWRHLADDGILGISRARGWQTLRLASVLASGLEEVGVEDVHRHVAIVTNERWCDVLVSKKPYTSDQVAVLRKWAEASGLPVVFDPFTPGDADLDRMLKSHRQRREAFIRISPTNLRATTDDNPFFFEALSLSSIVGNSALDLRRMPNSGFPVLFMALFQAAVLGALLILLPLASRGGVSRRIAGQWWMIPYFSLLGLGFILVELVFIQKYMIVVGGPARAMSVTLFTILSFGGLGAFFSRRIATSSRMALVGSIVAVVVLLVGALAFLRFGLPTVIGLGFAARVAIGIAVLAPVSFALGVPFPLGIRMLERPAPDLVPWAWACNACLTVVGSVLCLIISMAVGFTAAMLLAAGCYGLAAVCVAMAPAEAQAVSPGRTIVDG
jgi:spermidine synthase